MERSEASSSLYAGTMKSYKRLFGIGLAFVLLVAVSLPFVVEDVQGASTSGSGANRKILLYNTTADKNLKVIVNYSTSIGLDRDYYNVTIKWIPLNEDGIDEDFSVYVDIQEVNKSVTKRIDFDGTNTDSLISFDTDLFIEEDSAYYNVTLYNQTEAQGDFYAGTTEIARSSMTGMIMWIMPVMITLAMLSLILGMIGGITKKGFNFGGK